MINYKGRVKWLNVMKELLSKSKKKYDDFHEWIVDQYERIQSDIEKSYAFLLMKYNAVKRGLSPSWHWILWES
jgi:hypothetical protein